MKIIKHKVKTSATDSVNSVAKDGSVGIELTHTAKLMPNLNIQETIDEYEVYESERNACEKYRLILTIKPYCSNILFNTLTEIIKDEGSNEPIVITDVNKGSVVGEVQGVTSPTRNQMIMNTEYSKDDIGYDYHPGFDMFNNHILRNTSFKMVSKKGNVTDIKDQWDGFPDTTSTSTPASKTPTDSEAFNTIGDFMRDKDGNIILYKKRTGINNASSDTTTYLYKHLYLNQDILSFEEGDAINENLKEKDGWFGFYNNSTISAKSRGSQTDNVWEDMDISRILNNYEDCEFIDMYPDRTLYSFNPKYNSFQHRNEYNWKAVITYPYRNDTSHILVSNERDGDGKTNALLILSIQKIDGTSDTPMLLVRTYCKHGLKQSNDVYFYYSNDGLSYTKTELTYRIYKTGDLDGENTDYYFLMSDLGLIEEALGDDYWYNDNGKFSKSDSEINNALSKLSFRFTHYVNGVESEYYFRIFRKLPNLRAKKQNLSYDIAEDVEKFEEYTKENASDKESGSYTPLRDFNHTQYQLAFANTIYSDACTQITFTDALDVEYITDNLKRPLTSLYITIVKNNKGYNEWYGKQDYNPEDVEFSHCFGRVTSGLLYHTETDDNDTNTLNERGRLSDVRVINNLDIFSSSTLGASIKVEGKNSGEEDINYQDNEFIGDVVEFIPCEAKEVVLSDVYHRFNTAQREISDITSSDAYSSFQYQEITADDYDLSVFTLTNFEITDNIERPEGYYYKAHYEIPIKSFGSVNQDSHTNLRVASATPIQLEGIYIKITTKLPHGCSLGNTIYICDDALDIWYETNVVYVDNDLEFTINTIQEVNWIKLCDILNSTDSNKQYKLRLKNDEIPNYAVRVGENKFLWRDIIRTGDVDSDLPEYIFANGYLYIEQNLNFFLHRQDSDGKSGLYNYSKNFFPNDVSGEIESEDIYDYDDIKETEC